MNMENKYKLIGRFNWHKDKNAYQNLIFVKGNNLKTTLVLIWKIQLL